MTVKNNVISISGRKRAGKDTVADMIIKRVKRAQRVALADPMKYIVANMLKITLEELEVLKNDESNPHRWFLQSLGQDAKLYFGEDCWAEYARHVIANLPKGATAIITDIRFPFERRGGDLTINVVNDRLGVNTDSHQSENGMEGAEYDITIYNNGTLKELEAKVKKIVDSLYKTEWLT